MSTLSLAETFAKKTKEADEQLDILCHVIFFSSTIDKIKERLLIIINNHIPINKLIPRKCLNGSLRLTNPLLTWAQDRYEGSFTSNNGMTITKELKHWDRTRLEEDANTILKMLLDCGADPYICYPDTKQDALHVAMADGFPQCVKALISQVKYNIGHLSNQDSFGDSVVHSALSNAHYECCETILFSTPGGTDLTLENILNRVEDDQGDGILSALIKYTDVDYKDPDVSNALTVSSTSYDLLNKIIRHLKQTNNSAPLMRQNKWNENIIFVAARCGTIHELKLVLSNFPTVLKTCLDPSQSTSLRTYIAPESNSPLELASETLLMIENNLNKTFGGDLKHFEKARICGCEEYVQNADYMESWKISMQRCIKLLK